MTKLISTSQLDALCREATASARGRAHSVLHAGNDDPVQRFFVAADLRTYVRPHRHHTNSELVTVLRGKLDLLIFDEAGAVGARYELGTNGPNIAFEAAAAAWHTLIARTDGCVFLEVKEGPYNPATAVEFAHWAPAENTPTVPAFQNWLRHAQPGDRPPSGT